MAHEFLKICENFFFTFSILGDDIKFISSISGDN